MIPHIHIIARALHGSCLLNKLPKDTDPHLDSVVLGDNTLERTYIVEMAREGRLDIVEPSLELSENWCSDVDCRTDFGGFWVVGG